MLLSVVIINGNGTFFWKNSGLFHKQRTLKIISIKNKLLFKIKIEYQQYAEHKTLMQYKNCLYLDLKKKRLRYMYMTYGQKIQIVCNKYDICCLLHFVSGKRLTSNLFKNLNSFISTCLMNQMLYGIYFFLIEKLEIRKISTDGQTKTKMDRQNTN